MSIMKLLMTFFILLLKGMLTVFLVVLDIIDEMKPDEPKDPMQQYLDDLEAEDEEVSVLLTLDMLDADERG